MNKIISIFKSSYIYLILMIFYLPLFFGFIYSFSASPKRGNMSHIFSFTGDGWSNLFSSEGLIIRIIASFIIAILVGIIVSSLSLLTVYGLWKGKSKIVKGSVVGTIQIPLINPDVITAISLMLVFTFVFGFLERGNLGLARLIISQSVMILPFGITIMLPKSEKFPPSLMEASNDLGFNPVVTWFQTYFRFMLTSIIATFFLSVVLSFDDFIITKTNSRVKTIGLLMYSEPIKPWILAFGTLAMLTTISVSFLGAFFIKKKKRKENKKWKTKL